jgi:site-specific recombinase XerD
MYDEAVTPETAVEEFLEAKSHEVSDATIQNLRYRLKQFRLWTDKVGLDDMRELEGRDCEKWKLARANSGLAPITMRHQIRTFVQLLRWCGVMGYCEQNLHEMVRVPEVDREDRRRDEAISYKRATRIASYLSQFEYASRQHIVFGLLWHTAMRTGSLIALDVDDVSYADDSTMYLEVRHRSETNTPLKLGSDGERNVTIGDPELTSAIEDWIEHKRPDTEDDHGRHPLIATNQGRVSKTTVRVDVYRATQPCMTDDCPHGNERSSCEFTEHDKSGGCPSSISPHSIRRSAITAHLDQGTPKEILSERAAVNVDTLEEHYDNRSSESARTTRQGYIEDLRF